MLRAVFLLQIFVIIFDPIPSKTLGASFLAFVHRRTHVKIIASFTATGYFYKINSSKDSQKYQWIGSRYCDRYSLILLKG